MGGLDVKKKSGHRRSVFSLTPFIELIRHWLWFERVPFSDTIPRMIRAALSVVSLFFAITAGTCWEAIAAPRQQSTEQDHAELEGVEIRNVKLFAWQGIGEKRKYSEVQEFREITEQHLIPADRFDVRCEVVGGSRLLSGDFFLWTTVSFLVAPVMRAYEQMDNNELGSS